MSPNYRDNGSFPDVLLYGVSAKKVSIAIDTQSRRYIGTQITNINLPIFRYLCLYFSLWARCVFYGYVN